MGTNPTPKFQIGQTVRYIRDLEGDNGIVISYSYSASQGFVYTISSKEIDVAAKAIVDGIKVVTEDELVEVNININNNENPIN